MMQRGCMQRNTRKEGPDVWQFRWSETRLDGKRLYHKKIVGTVEQYPDENAARRSVVGLVSELNTDGRPTNSGTMTVAQLCDPFEQRELPKENTWRSHATKKIYKVYLTRWIRPHWQKYGLAEVRTIQVESWLRGSLVLSAGTEGVNSILKFFKYSKEDKKATAAAKDPTGGVAANAAASVPTVDALKRMNLK